MGNFFAAYTGTTDAAKEIGKMGTKIAENKSVKLERTEEKDLAESSKDAVRKRIKTDAKLDKHLRKEPKDLLCFDNQLDYLKTLDTTDPYTLYWGDRDQIRNMIIDDPARMLKDKVRNKRDHDTLLLKMLQRSKANWFIVVVHRKTRH